MKTKLVPVQYHVVDDRGYPVGTITRQPRLRPDTPWRWTATKGQRTLERDCTLEEAQEVITTVTKAERDAVSVSTPRGAER